MNNINNCPVCDSESISFFLKRLNVPVHQNILCKSYNEARSLKRGDINLYICYDCSFIFNKTFNPDILSYGDDYDNNQNHSTYFSNYIDEQINNILEKNKNKTIVEVGCGNGEFIKRIIRQEKYNNIGYGFDPSYKGDLSLYNNKLNFKKEFYSSNNSVKADVVISRHVIEHVHEPFKFMTDIYKALNKDTDIYIETPDVNWILKNKVVFDIFYEHCSYFNYHSISTLFKRLNLNIRSLKSIFNQQYMWVESDNKSVKSNDEKIDLHKNVCLNSIEEFKAYEKFFIDYWIKKIKELSINGEVCIWGSGAKGVTFANMIDPDCELIKYFIDINPNKNNKYIPGTGHLIINYKMIKDLNIKSIIFMNKNYINESKLLLNSENINVDIFDYDISTI